MVNREELVNYRIKKDNGKNIFIVDKYSNARNIYIPQYIDKIDKFVFDRETKLENVYYKGTIEDWCHIKFGYNANPMRYAEHLYIKNSNNKWVEVKCEIEIPNTITSIGKYQFYGFNNVTSIIIPDSVTSIGNYAFSGCTSLKRINSEVDGEFIFSSNITSMGIGMLSGCSNVTKLTIPFVGSSKTATEASSSTLFGYIFGSDSYTGGVKTEQYYSSNSPYCYTYYIPFSLKEVIVLGGNISSYSFYNCSNIESITLPNDITSIGERTFYNCDSLTSIEIPNRVTSIGIGAFYNCSNIESITLPNNITSIGERAFYKCSSLTSIVIGVNVTSIGNYAFFRCSSLALIEIPDSVTSIGAYAFQGCTSLMRINSNIDGEFRFSSNITSMGEGMLSGCSNVIKLTIPFVGSTKTATGAWKTTLFGYIFGRDSYTGGISTQQYYLSSYSSIYCISSTLKEVTVLGGNILYGAFSNCSNIETIILGDNVTNIEENAFYNCSSLTTIEIPDNILNIGKDCFINTKIYNDKNNWKNGILYICNVLVKCRETYVGEVVIRNNTCCICSYAFENCATIIAIQLPESISSICNNAFNGCSSLEEVYYEGTIEDWCNIIFSDYLSNPMIYAQHFYLRNINNEWNEVDGEIEIPNTTIKIYDYQFSNFNKITSIIIPSSVTSIGFCAFYGCSKLEHVYYEGTIESWCNIKFSNEYSNPMFYAQHFYLRDNDNNWKEVTEIKIPNGITKIGYGFYGFNNVTKIFIPSSVTIIREYAFKGCTSLRRINSEVDGEFIFSSNIISMGRGMLSGCSNVTKLTIPFVGVSNKLITYTSEYYTLFGYIFGRDSYTGGISTRQYYGSSSSKYSNYYIPSSLKEVTVLGGSILYGAFSNCSNIESITLPNNITSIGDYAFYNCDSLTSIVIPDIVTSIGEIAFYNCRNLTSIKIPNSVTNIGKSAFSHCSGLISIEIPNSVTSIREYAFKDCTSLKRINSEIDGEFTFSSNITTIGYAMLSGCSNVTKLTIPFVASDGFGWTFGKSSYIGGVKTEQYYTPCDYSKYYIPSSLKEVIVLGGNIRYGSFSNCTNIESIILGDNVTNIEENAFYNCSSLTTIEIPDTVTRIGNYAFSGCTSLKRINSEVDGEFIFSSNKTSMKKYMLSGRNNVTKLVIPFLNKGLSDILDYNKLSSLKEITILGGNISSHAFQNCSNIETIILGDNVTSIGEEAFFECSKLKNIYYDGTIKSWRFSYETFIAMGKVLHFYLKNSDNKWEEVKIKKEISNTVTILKNNQFYGFNIATSIIIPDSITSIETDFFEEYNKLENVYYEGTIESWCKIEFNNLYSNPMYYASHFYLRNSNNDWEEVIEIEIPNTITTIGNYQFYGFNNVTSIIIPDSVTRIGYFAFDGCSNLTNVYYEGTIESWCNKTFTMPSDNIMAYASHFYLRNSNNEWEELTDINIPNTITTIGNYQFYGFNNVTSIVISDSVIGIGEGAFYECSKLTSIAIGENAKSIGNYAFYNCSSLTSIVITDSVTSIGSYAFSGCTSLNRINSEVDEEFIFSSNITSMGEGMLSGCSNVTKLTIPFVGSNKTVSTASSSTLFGYIFGEDSYTGGVSTKQYYSSSSYYSSTYYIPSSLKEVTVLGGNILYGAFYNCNNIESITLSNNITSIGDNAFYGCNKLTSIEISDSVTSIGSSAFSNCSNLQYNEYDNGLYVGNDNNPYLVLVKAKSKDITSCKINNDTKFIYYTAFNNCSRLKTLIIGNGVTSLPYGLLNGCSSLESLTIPFVGRNGTATSSSSSTLFGYIFGESSYTGGVSTQQYYSSFSYSTYYIPSSLKEVIVLGGNIPNYAFYNCSNIESIILGDNVTSIGDYAFKGCTSLKRINSEIDGEFIFSSNITSMGEGVLSGCSNVTKLTIPFVGANGIATSSSSSTLFGYIFGKDSYAGGVKTLQYYNSSSIYSYNIYYIPSSLKEVTVLGGYILHGAFSNCSMLKTLIIGNGVTSLSYGLLNGCNSLESLTIPFVGRNGTATSSSSSTLFGYIFGGNSYKGGVSTQQYYSILSSSCSTYYIPSSLKEVTVLGGNILFGAFSNCSNIESIILGDNVTSIGDYAFKGCTSLKRINSEVDGEFTFSSNITSMGKGMLSGCSNVTKLTIPYVSSKCFGYIFGSDSYTGGVATKQYYSLTSSSIYYIPSSLKEVTVLGGNLLLGAFYNCSSLTSIVIPDRVTSIGIGAFYNCSNIESITLPNNITSIGERAFYKCSSLTSIVIGDNVTSIGKKVFFGCNGLIVYCKASFRLRYWSYFWNNKSVYWYRETRPRIKANYWHYVNGVVTKW